MKRKKAAFVMLLCLTGLLYGCSKSGSLPDEPYTEVSRQLFPAPEGAYVGDTMPFVTEDGMYMGMNLFCWQVFELEN